MKIELKVLFLVVILMVSHVAKGQFIPIFPGELHSSIAEYPYMVSSPGVSIPSPQTYIHTIVRNYKDSLNILYEYNNKHSVISSRFYIGFHQDTNSTYFDINDSVLENNGVVICNNIEVKDIQILGNICYFCGVNTQSFLLTKFVNKKGVMGRFNIEEAAQGIKKVEIINVDNTKSLNQLAVYKNFRDSVVVDMVGQIGPVGDTIAIVKLRSNVLAVRDTVSVWHEFYEYLPDPNEVLTDVIATPSYLITSSYFKDEPDSIGIRYKKIDKPFFDMGDTYEYYTSDKIYKYCIADLQNNKCQKFRVNTSIEKPLIIERATGDDFIMSIGCINHNTCQNRNKYGVIICKMNPDFIYEAQYLEGNSILQVKGITYLSTPNMAIALVQDQLQTTPSQESSQMRCAHFGIANIGSLLKDTIYYLSDELQSIDSFKGKSVILSGVDDNFTSIVGYQPRYWNLMMRNCYSHIFKNNLILINPIRKVIELPWSLKNKKFIRISIVNNYSEDILNLNSRCYFGF